MDSLSCYSRVKCFWGSVLLFPARNPSLGQKSKTPSQSSRLLMFKKNAMLPESFGFTPFLLFVEAFKIILNRLRVRTDFVILFCLAIF